MILVVSGSRVLRAHERELVGRIFAPFCEERRVTNVYHGAARGVDSYLAALAEYAGLGVRAFQADWNRHGKAAGMLRNGEMLTQARLAGGNTVLAFPRPGGRGTQHMINEAATRGFEVLVHRVLE